MLQVWIYTICSVVLVSLLSLVGVLTLALTRRSLQSLLLILVSFSAGALLGDAFIHIIPESIEMFGWHPSSSLGIILGIILFFILEKYIHWHHHHHVTDACDEALDKRALKPLAYTVLAGDAFHNFIDGLIIAGTFLVSIPLGIATTVAVALHEIPQEIGDFGVLLHAGFSRKKALLYNFLCSLTAILGAVVVLIIGATSTQFMHFLLPLTAGGFIYIAATDLMPEMHKETHPLKSAAQLIALVVGVSLMLLLGFIE